MKLQIKPHYDVSTKIGQNCEALVLTRHGAAYLEACLQKLREGSLLFVIAHDANKDDVAGYAVYNRAPTYRLYQSQNLPEIQDLYVVPPMRGQGVATSLLDACEGIARDEERAGVGVSVPLAARFGTAQILYISRGYVPDGQGVTYERAPVADGQHCAVDDQLCLMLVKLFDKT